LTPNFEAFISVPQRIVGASLVKICKNTLRDIMLTMFQGADTDAWTKRTKTVCLRPHYIRRRHNKISRGDQYRWNTTIRNELQITYNIRTGLTAHKLLLTNSRFSAEQTLKINALNKLKCKKINW